MSCGFQFTVQASRLVVCACVFDMSVNMISGYSLTQSLFPFFHDFVNFDNPFCSYTVA